MLAACIGQLVRRAQEKGIGEVVAPDLLCQKIGIGMRIHTGLGDSVPSEKPNIRTRLIFD